MTHRMSGGGGGGGAGGIRGDKSLQKRSIDDAWGVNVQGREGGVKMEPSKCGSVLISIFFV